jgi:hypothetical protein
MGHPIQHVKSITVVHEQAQVKVFTKLKITFKAGGGGGVDEANMKKSIEEIKKLQVSILFNFVVTDALVKQFQPSLVYL